MELYSEFEGTVQKDPRNVLGAGALETLLGNDEQHDAASLTCNMRKKAADLDKDCGELCISIYDLKELTAKWQSLDLCTIILSWDEKAHQLAKKREDYLTNRRMKLKNEVRKYDGNYFNECGEDVEQVKSSILATIAIFKSEYDHVALCYKFCEDLFLDVYKYMRDVTDPSSLLGSSTRLCSRAHDSMKGAQEQMKLASDILDDFILRSKDTNITPSSSIEAVKHKFEKELDALKTAHKTEIKGAKTKFDIEVKSREQKLNELLQSQYAETTNHLQEAIASKDNQIAELMLSLSNTRSYTLELEERDRNYVSEIQKRRDIEDKLRVALVELSGSENRIMSMKLELEAALSKNQSLESKMSTDIQSLESALKGYKLEENALRAKLESAEIDLHSRPDSGFSRRIIESLRKISGDFVFVNSGLEDETIPFDKIEALICESVRTSHTLAIDARLKKNELMVELDVAKAELLACRQAVAENNILIASLEKDIISTHEKLNPSSYNSSSSYSSSVNSNDSSSSSNSSSSSSSISNINNCEDGGGSSSDKFVLALRSQRDRFMKMSADRERELEVLQQTIESLNSSLADLKKENVELYTRLQSIRSSGGGGVYRGGDIESSFNYGNYGDDVVKRGGHADSRGCTEDDDDSGGGGVEGLDSIDNKYGKMYRDAAENDKNINNLHSHSINNSSSNFLFSYFDSWDRSFQLTFKSFMKDMMVRRLFLGYLFIVHLLAWGYVIQVINPQLIEEVDAIARTKYSTETLSIDMFMEHPDV